MKSAMIILMSFVYCNLSGQSVSHNKNKIRIQNIELKTNKANVKNNQPLNENRGSWEELLRDENGNITAKFGYIDNNGKPHYFTNLSYDAAVTTSTDKLHSDAGLGYDLDGSGLNILINEAGSPRATHELFEGNGGSRVVTSTEPISGHATWVAGIIGSNDNLGISNRGMAPNVSLEMQENYVDQYLENLVSNHSIIRSNGTYQPFFDGNTFDAPMHLEVTASGNVVGNSYYLANNSKNELTVGNVNDIAEYNSPLDVVYSSSGVGPTIDGRIKPDVVANGVSVSSASSSSDSAIFNSGGSSASCANASGSLILVQEYYNLLVDSFMRASTLKALAVHTATEAGSNPGPDYIYGYGLLNTVEMVKLLDEDEDFNLIYEESLSNNDVFELDVFPNYDEPLIVTLAWTDPSNGQFIFPYDGNEIDTSLRALVNDLDVKIFGEGVEYYPYRLDRMDPCAPPTNGVNSRDNLEMIEIPNLPNIDGAYTIVISHKGTLVNAIQDFSLIVTGIGSQSSQSVLNTIRIEENESFEWELEKTQMADIIIAGDLIISDLTTVAEKSINVVSGGSLTLQGSQLNGVNLYMHPESNLIISGQINLYNSNITILGEGVINYESSAELNVNDLTSSVQKLGLYDETLANIITGSGQLNILPNEGYLLDTICVNSVISQDSTISGYDNIIIGDMPNSNVCVENESALTVIGNNITLADEGIVVLVGSELIISQYVGNDELIVPNVNVNAVVHKYYNGMTYPSQFCFHVPINVYVPD